MHAAAAAFLSSPVLVILQGLQFALFYVCSSYGIISNESLTRFLQVDKLLDTVKWDDKGLAVAIVQHVNTGAILMQGFANRDALATTISSRKATFYSRSRSKLWTKGETSSNFINVCDIFLDCDRDSVSFSIVSWCSLFIIAQVLAFMVLFPFTDNLPRET